MTLAYILLQFQNIACTAAAGRGSELEWERKIGKRTKLMIAFLHMKAQHEISHTSQQQCELMFGYAALVWMGAVLIHILAYHQHYHRSSTMGGARWHAQYTKTGKEERSEMQGNEIDSKVSINKHCYPAVKHLKENKKPTSVLLIIYFQFSGWFWFILEKIIRK